MKLALSRSLINDGPGEVGFSESFVGHWCPVPVSSLFAFRLLFVLFVVGWLNIAVLDIIEFLGAIEDWINNRAGVGLVALVDPTGNYSELGPCMSSEYHGELIIELIVEI